MSMLIKAVTLYLILGVILAIVCVTHDKDGKLEGFDTFASVVGTAISVLFLPVWTVKGFIKAYKEYQEEQRHE